MSATETKRIDRGRGHTYLLDGHKVLGVTSILSAGLPKPALINWAGNVTAEYAVDHWAELADLGPSQKLKALKDARYADRDTAANRGTQVHAIAERLVAGEKIDVPEELAGHVESYVRFLDEWDPQPVTVERPVFSRRYSYAGTLDLIADLADGTRRLLDVKTNRSGPFGEVAFQLAAYRNADFYLDDNGGERPMPDVDGAAVIWVRADGYDLYPFDTGPAVFRQFLYIAQVAAAAEASRYYKNDAAEPPTREDATA